MKKQIPILAILFCCMIWGTTFVVLKDISDKIDPYLLSTLRNCISFVLLIPIILISKNRESFKNIPAIKSGFILGTILSAIYIVQTIGLQFTSANHSAFISCSAVILVPVILVIFTKQRITLKQIISILIVTIGIYFLTNVGNDFSLNSGDLITLLSAFIVASHIILSGHFVRKVDFLGLVFYQFLFAAILSYIGLFLNSYFTGKEIIFEKSSINGVLYLGVLGSLFCFFVTVWAQKFVSTIFTAMIFSLEPLFAALTSYFYIGETFTFSEVIGAITIFSGLIIYSLTGKKEEIQ
jgi:drug/metabolite transporter (DMT)-like permease